MPHVVSPYVFILAIEILLIKINHIKNIEGITYAKKENRSETFADDTSIFIKRNLEYLRECLAILKHFAEISGLQCNLEKTSVIPIEGNFDTSDSLCPELALNWESDFTFLGFQIDSRLNKLDDYYEKCYKKMHGISRKWARYQLSIKGHMAIAKTFLLPQFTYSASVLDPSYKTYENISHFIGNFIDTGTTKLSTRNYLIHQDILY